MKAVGTVKRERVWVDQLLNIKIEQRINCSPDYDDPIHRIDLGVRPHRINLGDRVGLDDLGDRVNLDDLGDRVNLGEVLLNS